MKFRLPAAVACLLAIGWCAALLLVWNQLLAHTYRPANTPGAVAAWPVIDQQFDSTGVNILVFAHPFCPCTRATLAELEDSLQRASPELKVTIVFITAGLSADDVDRSATVAAAKQFPRVALQFDPSADMAKLFGASVSGEVFVFDAAGNRVFHGGITAGRGHRGHSVSKEAFEQVIRGKYEGAGEFPLFGCRLPQGAEQNINP